MNRILTVIVLALVLAGCGKGCGKSSKPVASASSSATQPATPPQPFVQKGVAPDKVIVGYVQDISDPSMCSAVSDAPEGKEVFERAGDHYAKLVHAKVVPSCPTDNVVGTCDNGVGLLTNYSGPKWTAETAKKHCNRTGGRKFENRKWLD